MHDLNTSDSTGAKPGGSIWFPDLEVIKHPHMTYGSVAPAGDALDYAPAMITPQPAQETT